MKLLRTKIKSQNSSLNNQTKIYRKMHGDTN